MRSTAGSVHVTAVNPGRGTPRAPRLLSLGLLITTLAIALFPTDATGVQLKAIGRFGFDGVHSMVYSPMGNLIAVGTTYGMQVVDAKTGRPVVMFPQPFGGAAFSPDERTIASPGSIRTDLISLWDIESGQETGRLEGGGRALAFSPDGSLLAGVASEFDEDGNWIANNGFDIALWSLATRRKIAVLGRGSHVRSLAFSPDGTTVATGGGDEFIRLWDVASRREIATLTGHADAVQVVAFSPDGRTLASGGSDGGAKLWDVGAGQETATLAGHTDRVSAVVFSTDGETLATGSDDHTVRLWDIASARETAVLTGHESRILMVAFSADGSSVVGGSYLDGNGDIESAGNAIRVWDLASRRQVDSFGGLVDPVQRLAFGPDGNLIATRAADGSHIALWDVTSGRRVGTLTGAGTLIDTPVFSPDGTILATWSLGGVTLWDVASWQPAALLAGSRGGIAFSPDGTILATGGRDEFIALWDIASLQRVATLVGHADGTSTLAFSPDGSILAGGGLDRARIPRFGVWLWDVVVTVDAARAIGPDVPLFVDFARWYGSDDEILDIEFSPDGQLLACGDRAEVTRLWDVAARRQVASLDAPDRSRAIAFSPDGRILASTGNGGNGTLWDVESREAIGTIKGSDWGFPSALAFSPDGTLLATGDRGVFLWGVTDSPTDIPTAVEPRGKARATWAQVKRAALTPSETAFLPNFPNPFNPETWIPFDLHESAGVTVSIHDAGGRVVRSLDLGEHPAGAYRTRDRAAHWDGRNEQGEFVSSGVYFAELTAGDYRDTRRITVRK